MRIGILERLRGKDRLRARLGSERGSAYVEVALVMPLFLLVIVGVAEYGRLAYYAIEVNNAAYAGAAYGAQSRATAAQTTYMETAATTDGSDVPGISATATTSCSCTNGTAITCANAATNCTSPGRIVESVQVNTSATLNSIFNYPGIPSSFSLTGQATMQVEQ